MSQERVDRLWLDTLRQHADRYRAAHSMAAEGVVVIRTPHPDEEGSAAPMFQRLQPEAATHHIELLIDPPTEENRK